jgi:hypothetical protein
MVPVLLALALAAEPSSPPPSVAFPGLNAVNLVAGEGELRTEVIAQRLSARGVKVVTGRDLATVLGVERQQQLMGCGSEASSCAIEMLAAAGTGVVLSGDLGNLGGEYTLTLKALSTKDGHVLAQHSGHARGEAELSALFDAAVNVLAAALAPNSPMAISPTVTVVRPTRSWSWLPAAVGVLSVGAGVTFEVLASGKYATLTTGMRPLSMAQSLASDGKTFEFVALGSFIGGGVAIAVAAVLFFLPAPVQTALGLEPMSTGAFFVRGGP